MKSEKVGSYFTQTGTATELSFPCVQLYDFSHFILPRPMDSRPKVYEVVGECTLNMYCSAEIVTNTKTNGHQANSSDLTACLPGVQFSSEG